eukprot:3940573-Rhodomonas_salina.1
MAVGVQTMVRTMAAGSRRGRASAGRRSAGGGCRTRLEVVGVRAQPDSEGSDSERWGLSE